MEVSLTLQPIGTFRSDKKNKMDAASQGTLDQSDERGLIELNPGQNFEQALRGLGQMSHLWVLFAFNQNETWKPLVQVPRGSIDKQGVFATRSPYRPNPIGLSLVEIDEVGERKIWIRNFDLLDGSPILDLKPFHPEADVPLQPKLGWMEHLSDHEFTIMTEPHFDQQTKFLFDRGVKTIAPFCQQQLRFDPFNSEKKRVKLVNNNGVLAYRTWRIVFVYRGTSITLQKIVSGYTSQDLADPADKWNDKALHREFIAAYGK